MRKRSFIRCMKFLIVTGIVLLSFPGCKTIPKANPVQPFNVLDDDSSLYISLPVQFYEDLTVDILMKSVGELKKEDAQYIASRIDMLYAGIGSSDNASRVQFCLTGTIPKSAHLVLNARHGWQKEYIYPDRGNTRISYVGYSRQDYPYEFSFLTDSLVCAAVDVRPMVVRYDTEANGIGVIPRDGSDLNSTDVSWLTNSDSEIRFCVLRPQAFLAKLLGIDMRLALKNAHGFFSKSEKGGILNLTLYLTFQKPEAVQAASAIVRISAGRGSNIEVVHETGTAELTIRNIEIAQQQLVELLTK